MERKLASVQRIVSLDPIEGADQIEKATVLGWEVVVAKKDKFKVGDLCVYCEVDSILPDKTEFEFLRERKFRIKTIKLKGQVSQGICFPLSILPTKFPTKGNYIGKDLIVEGLDVTDVLSIIKYDPQAEFECREKEKLRGIYKNRVDKFFKQYAWYRRLIFHPARYPFPSFIKKTDEDRIQLFPYACTDWREIPFEITEKLDGQSVSYFILKNPKKWQFWKKFIFGVCSRNFYLHKQDNSTYWNVARNNNIEKKIKNLYALTQTNNGLYIIQGELVGPKIQGNKYMLPEVDLFVFDIYENGLRLDNESITRRCWHVGLRTVPMLFLGTEILSSIPLMVSFAKGISSLAQIPREGLVWRNYEKNISFKVINPDFLLKYGE